MYEYYRYVHSTCTMYIPLYTYLYRYYVPVSTHAEVIVELELYYVHKRVHVCMSTLTTARATIRGPADSTPVYERTIDYT